MPIGTCDPATRGMAYNEGAQDSGPVKLTYRYGWDGVSTRETGCVGPLLRLTVQNLSATETWYVHMKGKRGQPQVFTLTPGFNATYNQGQLGSRGMDTNEDLDELHITQSPTPPPA